MNANLYPTNFYGQYVGSHNDHDTYWTNGGLLAGLDGCGNPMVVVEATAIPSWIWLVAGGVALLFLMKKR